MTPDEKRAAVTQIVIRLKDWQLDGALETLRLIEKELTCSTPINPKTKRAID